MKLCVLDKIEFAYHLTGTHALVASPAPFPTQVSICFFSLRERPSRKPAILMGIFNAVSYAVVLAQLWCAAAYTPLQTVTRHVYNRWVGAVADRRPV